MIKKLYTLICTLSLLIASSTFSMEETYPCENCQQEKSLLNRYRDNHNNGECLHILCQECYNSIEKPTNNNDALTCNLCHYFYTQKHKQCWYKTNTSDEEGIEINIGMDAQELKSIYQNRILPNIACTNVTAECPYVLCDRSPTDPCKYILCNPDNPPQVPDHGHTSLTINNKLKWLSITGIAGVICYGAYKAYVWRKGKDLQEQDDIQAKQETCETIEKD